MNPNPKGTGNLDQSALLQQMAELQTQLDSYKSELADLRQQVSGTRRDSQIVAATQEVTSRRKMMRRLGVGAGVVTLGALSATSALAAYNANDNAVDTTAGTNGYGLNVNAAGLAHVRLVPPAAAGGAPALTDHQVGELYAAGNGTLYYAAGTGAAATPHWTTLATATSSGPVSFAGKRINLTPSNSAPISVDVRTQLSAPTASGIVGTLTLFAPTGQTFNGSEYVQAGAGPAPAGKDVVTGVTDPNTTRLAVAVFVGLDASGIMHFRYNGTITPAAMTFDVAAYFN